MTDCCAPGENDRLHLMDVDCDGCGSPLVAEWTVTALPDGTVKHLNCTVANNVIQRYPEFFERTST